MEGVSIEVRWLRLISGLGRNRMRVQAEADRSVDSKCYPIQGEQSESEGYERAYSRLDVIGFGFGFGFRFPFVGSKVTLSAHVAW